MTVSFVILKSKKPKRKEITGIISNCSKGLKRLDINFLKNVC